ncbi:hypothetical protein C8A01DRAFT_14260, partial [Parachaetomium inaequale]
SSRNSRHSIEANHNSSTQGAMEALRPRPSGTPSRRRHDYQRSRGHSARDGQAKDHKRSLQTRPRHSVEITRPLEDLGGGPVPRSKEKNDAFVQSWLQQTQARHSHLPETGHEKGRLQPAEQRRPSERGDKHRKRPRSLSGPPPPSPRRIEEPEYRFEKRARHKTRDDKYDYKAPAGNKRVSDQGFREHGPREAAGRRSQTTKGRHSVSGPRTNDFAGC